MPTRPQSNFSRSDTASLGHSAAGPPLRGQAAKKEAAPGQSHWRAPMGAPCCAHVREARARLARCSVRGRSLLTPSLRGLPGPLRSTISGPGAVAATAAAAASTARGLHIFLPGEGGPGGSGGGALRARRRGQRDRGGPPQPCLQARTQGAQLRCPGARARAAAPFPPGPAGASCARPTPCARARHTHLQPG